LSAHGRSYFLQPSDKCLHLWNQQLLGSDATLDRVLESVESDSKQLLNLQSIHDKMSTIGGDGLWVSGWVVSDVMVAVVVVVVVVIGCGGGEH
jgi:hypothetical protein